MKLQPLLCAVLLAACASIAMPKAAAQDTKPAKAAKAGKRSESKKAKAGKLQHVVAFKFKDTASKDDVKKVEEAFRALKTKIPQVQKLAWGLNNSPEGLNKGCTHGWILTFNSEEDRNAYLVHPDHKEFGTLVKPLIADVFVLDFWAKD
ncbi:MAG: Dabb family protein [Verrucomicrobiota bacterium]|jgi:16S rRNA C1402 N4-methylase RsmH